MRVIGTAGHVDHGKSTLVSALTGINPDRLKEEQIREMTIDLGFAWLTLPDGEQVGIIDVPGHRDFINNMLAGVGGIDAVILVIASDEGVMPQTREHLSILDLLRIKSGLIALSKADLVTDEDWLDLVEEDVRAVISQTFLRDAPIIRVSSRTGKGLDQLISELQVLLSEQPRRKDIGRPRLPIDRVFSIAGFGSVVTGTLLDGRLETGKEVEILPSGVSGRIRGLQSHKKKEDFAFPGSRVAVNISGLNTEQLSRGEVLCYPGQHIATKRLDTYFRMLPEIKKEIRHNDEMKFFLGAGETLARVRLIGCDALKAGDEGWMQLELEKAMVGLRGDHYILRRPSPGETVGGGILLNPLPAGRHKRFSPVVIREFETLYRGTPSEIIYQTLDKMGIVAAGQLLENISIPLEEARLSLESLLASNEVIPLMGVDERLGDKTFLISQERWLSFTDIAHRYFLEYHRKYPLRLGISKEELKSRLNLPAKQFQLLMERWVREGIFFEKQGRILIPGQKIQLSSKQQDLINKLLGSFQKSPYKPPSGKECQLEVGDDLLQLLVEQGVLIQVSDDVLFLESTYQEMLNLVKTFIHKNGSITVAQFRDSFNTSRKYGLSFLEYLDQKKITIRNGDERILA